MSEEESVYPEVRYQRSRAHSTVKQALTPRLGGLDDPADSRRGRPLVQDGQADLLDWDGRKRPGGRRSAHGSSRCTEERPLRDHRCTATWVGGERGLYTAQEHAPPP